MMTNFLTPFNVVSFKKSDRKLGLYVATCADYDGFDRLCDVQEAEIGKNCSYNNRGRP